MAMGLTYMRGRTRYTEEEVLASSCTSYSGRCLVTSRSCTSYSGRCLVTSLVHARATLVGVLSLLSFMHELLW